MDHMNWNEYTFIFPRKHPCSKAFFLVPRSYKLLSKSASKLFIYFRCEERILNSFCSTSGVEKWFLWQHRICQSSKRGRALKDVFPDFQLGDLPRIVFNPAERERQGRQGRSHSRRSNRAGSGSWIHQDSRA